MKKSFLFSIFVSFAVVFFQYSIAQAGLEHNTVGWAWSDTIGWISHNSVDDPAVPLFGVDIDEDAGALSGHAWNDALGYIDFSAATYDAGTGEISGTAVILDWGAGVGDISLRGTCGAACTYGVSVAPDGQLSGYGWNSTTGYIDFDPQVGPTDYGAIHNPDQNPSVGQYAWNDGFGWIFMRYDLYDVSYGVNLEENGNLSGYAWSELGWIDYDPAGPYPTSPTLSAQWDAATENILGWGQILSIDTAGDDGWILFSGDCAPTCGGFGVKLAQATGDWSGYAWNNSIGWILFDHAYGSVHTDFTSNGPATPVLTTPTNCVEVTDLTPSLDWSDYAALDGSTQQAFEIQVSDNDPFFDPGNLVIDYSTDNPPPAYPVDGSLYTVGLDEQLEYNKVYYWRVRVQSSAGDWSEYGITGPGGESNCFATPLHAPPVCAFNMIPTPPILEQPTQFTDESITYGGSVVAEWDWDFGDGNTWTGSDILVHQDPEHTYSTQEPITVSLTITDSDGYSCSIQESTSVTLSLPEIKRVTPR